MVRLSKVWRLLSIFICLVSFKIITDCSSCFFCEGKLPKCTSGPRHSGDSPAFSKLDSFRIHIWDQTHQHSGLQGKPANMNEEIQLSPGSGDVSQCDLFLLYSFSSWMFPCFATWRWNVWQRLLEWASISTRSSLSTCSPSPWASSNRLAPVWPCCCSLTGCFTTKVKTCDFACLDAATEY